MKKYNWLLALVIAAYGIIAISIYFIMGDLEKSTGYEYRIDINRIMENIIVNGQYKKPELDDYTYIVDVDYIESPGLDNEDTVSTFLESANGKGYEIRPVYDGDKLLGYVKFYYINHIEINKLRLYIELGLAFIFVLVFIVLVYIRQCILKPFNRFSEIPYQLAKGHLKGQVEESKNHFFGDFIWGLGLLKDKLESNRRKELKLEKEKKMMLLSISHDIKTPLNNIKLYAKALEEDLYTTTEDKEKAVAMIGEKVIEIENFVKEIVKTSSEDILDIEVNNSEFYITDLVEQINATYKDKCILHHIAFNIGDYENKLLRGDIDRAFEVVENIIENAYKYGDGRTIDISFYEEDYCQIISISNSGDPVNVQEFNHLFDSFFRGSNSVNKEGSGLGLYICKQIMVKMDGDIFAECENEGMRFNLVFKE